MPGVMDFFGNFGKSATAKAVPVTPQQPVSGTPTGQGGQPVAGGTPAQGGAPANPDGTPATGTASNDPNNFKNPLDLYKDLFHNTEDPAAPKAPEFKLSSEIVTKAAGSLNFTDGLPKELADKVAAGNLSPADHMDIMQHVGRQAYAKAMEHMSTLTDRFVGLRTAHEQQGLPKQLRNLLATTKAASLPSAQSNPVVKAHMELISSQLAHKYPDQTPDWIAEKAQSFFTDMAKAINPNFGSTEVDEEGEPKQGRRPAKMEMENFDWDGYLKDKTPS